jgi:hypothetical protein
LWDGRGIEKGEVGSFGMEDIKMFMISANGKKKKNNHKEMETFC